MSESAQIPATTKHTFLLLDALRGLAAISVTIYHFVGYMTSYGQRGLPNADLAVDFFFILSGFVIAYAYEARLLRGETFGNFMTRRLIRLYPIYLLAITLPMLALLSKNIVSMGAVHLSAMPVAYFFELFFLPTPPAFLGNGETTNLAITNIFPLNHPSWSLSLEIGVNVIFAVVCRGLSTTRLKIVLGAAGILFIATSFNYGSIDLGWSWPGYLGGWTRVSWSFFIGVFLYRLYALRKPSSLSYFLGLVLGLALFADFCIPNNGLFFELFNCFCFLPILVWFGARSSIWAPAKRIYAWLGRISYGLYLIHMPVIPILLLVAQHFKIRPYDHMPVTVAVATLVSIILASILDQIYDIPLRTALTKTFVRNRDASALQPVPPVAL